MSSLLRAEGGVQDFVYRPFQATWAAGVLYLCATAALGELSSDPLWPIWPPRGGLQLSFWLMVAMTPVMAWSIGWSYALTPSEFVVYRFGRERVRLPLREFKGNTTLVGDWLHFTSRRVYVVTGRDADRLLFLRELQLRARNAGSAGPSVMAEDGGVRLRVEALRFPDACVTCGERPTAKARIEASHWFGVPFVQGLKLEAPVCARHRRHELSARLLAWALLLGLGQAVVWAWALTSHHPWVAGGVIFLGLILGLILRHVASLLHLRTWIGWQTLGIRTSDLSGDLLSITIHTRSERLRRELANLPR